MKYLIFVLFAVLAFSNPIEAAQKERPNVLLIMVDDMGFSDIGCYGGEIQTPNLDKLANEGIRFSRYYNTAKCFPSRACLLTGQYAQHNGMAKKAVKFTNAVTIAEVLREAGYRTLMTGKHHGVENPFNFGFDRYFGLKDGSANHLMQDYNVREKLFQLIKKEIFNLASGELTVKFMLPIHLLKKIFTLLIIIQITHSTI